MRADRAAREVAREHDAVVDLDVVVVRGEVEVAGRREGDARRQVDRVLRLEIGGPEGLSHGAVEREGADLDGDQALAGDVEEVRADRGEVGLGERRGAEARAGRPADHETLVGLEAHRELPVDVAPEVAVVLEAAGGADPQAARDVALEVDIDGHVGARVVGLVRGTQAREDLCPRRGAAAVLGGHAAVHVRVGLPGLDLIAFAPELGAESHVERSRQAHRRAAARSRGWRGAGRRCRSRRRTRSCWAGCWGRARR